MAATKDILVIPKSKPYHKTILEMHKLQLIAEEAFLTAAGLVKQRKDDMRHLLHKHVPESRERKFLLKVNDAKKTVKLLFIPESAQ